MNQNAEKSILVNTLQKATKTLENKLFFFLDILRLLFSLREKVLNSFKKRLFPIKNLD